MKKTLMKVRYGVPAALNPRTLGFGVTRLGLGFRINS